MMNMRPPQQGQGGEMIEWLWRFHRLRRRARRQAARGRGQYWPCVLNWRASCTGGCGGAAWQDMEQEAADELVRRDRR